MRGPMTKLFDFFRAEDVGWLVAIVPPCHSERCSTLSSPTGRSPAGSRSPIAGRLF